MNSKQIITFLVTDDVRQALNANAQLLGVSRSALINFCINAYLAAYKGGIKDGEELSKNTTKV